MKLSEPTSNKVQQESSLDEKDEKQVNFSKDNLSESKYLPS